MYIGTDIWGDDDIGAEGGALGAEGVGAAECFGWSGGGSAGVGVGGGGVGCG